MLDSDTERLILDNLNEKENAPRPLNRDFYKDLITSPTVSSANSYDQIPVQPNVNSATESTVKRILQESQPLIEKAALKLVAPNAVNIVGPQYHDLVRLSVDEAAVVQAEEQKRNDARRRANATVLGRH